MLQDNIIQLTKKRLIAYIIDFFIFSFLFGTSLGLLSNVSSTYFFMIFLFAIYPALFIIFYFAIFVKLTNGYTLGGLIVGTKIIMLNNKQIEIRLLLKRLFYAIFLPVKFSFFRVVKVNSLGQFYFDEKYNTTIVNRNKNTLNIENKIEYYEHDYALEYIVFFGKYFLILLLISVLYNLVF